MTLILFREIVLLIATALASYTDWKTGLIVDRITYPLILIGVVVNFLEFEIFSFVIAGAIFVIGYALYYAGRIGGGDVKLFLGISLIMPQIKILPFVVYVLLFAAIIATICLGIYYVTKYVKKGIDWRENLTRIILSIFIGLAFLFYLVALAYLELVAGWYLVVVGVAIFFGLLFMAFERGIRKEFFLRKIKVSELEEDELLAIEFLDGKTKEVLGSKFKGILEENEIKKLKEAKIREVLVYRDLPKFAPFIFIGSVIGVVMVELGII